ncbi:MAG: hypothetical protein NVS3B2_07520 [Ramlibacter sp.]
MVPTQGVLDMLRSRGFRNLKAWTHGVDTSLFQFHPHPRNDAPYGNLCRPVALYVGRVSYEKNIDAFLALDLPGSKVVCGVGPVLATLQQRYPQVHWLGLLPRDELARVYAAADLFVFPSRSETFGLVMAEAMACGTPVAAFPVDGPLEVLGRAGLDGSGRLGGALNQDLREACYAALAVPRDQARLRALDFSWAFSSELFASHLVPARAKPVIPRRSGPLDAVTAVTKVSSGG